jgi:hypothetical protein
MSIHGLFLRFVLIFAMAIWSPAWCCCAVQAATARMTGEATCDALQQCAMRSAPQQTVRSCCIDLGDSESPCRCHDRPNELNRLDTAPKLAAPVFERVAIKPIVVADTVHRDFTVRGFTDEAIRQASRPFPRSLVAQHCLLLI